VAGIGEGILGEVHRSIWTGGDEMVRTGRHPTGKSAKSAARESSWNAITAWLLFWAARVTGMHSSRTFPRRSETRKTRLNIAKTAAKKWR